MAYRNDGGATIIRAVGDYARYKESRRRDELDRAYQRDRADESDRRWDITNDRAQTEHDNRLADRAERRTGLEQAYDTITNQMSPEEEQAAKERELADYDRFRQQAENTGLTQGSSGKGVELEQRFTDDGYYIFSNKDKNGNIIGDITDPPKNGKPIKFPDAVMPGIRNVIDRTSGEVDAGNLTREEANAAVRAAIVTDENGVARLASPEEHAANVSNQGFMPPKVPKKVKHRQLFPESNEAVGNFVGDIYQGIGDDGIVKSTGKRLMQLRGLKAQNERNALDELVGSANAVRKWFWKTDEESNTKPTVSVNKDLTPKVDPKADPADVVKAKEAADAEGHKFKVPKEFERFTKEGYNSPEAIQKTLEDRFKSKRTRTGKLKEAFMSGVVSKDELYNYGETGDMRYSKQDMLKLQSELNLSAAKAEEFRAKAEKHGLKGKYDDLQTFTKESKTFFNDRIETAVDASGLNSDYRREHMAKLKREVPRMMETLRTYHGSMNNNASFAVFFDEAAGSYLRALDNGEETSLTAHFTTVHKKSLRTSLASDLSRMSRVVGADVDTLTKDFNKLYDRYLTIGKKPPNEAQAKQLLAELRNSYGTTR